MGELWCDKVEREASERLQVLLTKQDIQDREAIDADVDFDPWELFPAVYGSYSSDFDDMAIEVLERIQAQCYEEEPLSHQMFREMLCTANLCTYGTSPRGCFPTCAFTPLLPVLIERWKRYRATVWAD